MKLAIIVPAYNEAPVLGHTLRHILKVTNTIKSRQVIVINDGSDDDTAHVAQKSGVTVLTHVLNRGLGGAIGTGLAYARLNNFDIAVTIDADGQHDPKDIFTIVKPIVENQADIVIGSRTISQRGKAPLDRQVMYRASNLLTWVLFGQTTTDSLSGFRAFNRKAIQSINIRTDRMEVSNELFSEVKRLRLKLAEVPIKVIYTSYSRAKGQSNTNAFNIVYKLILRLFR